MPNRILREGILTSERVDALSWPEECFYRRLLSVVDDFGRFSAHPKLLRAACYPLRLDKVSDSDIGKWISACETAGLVRVYTVEVDAADRKGRSETGKPADVSRTLPKRFLVVLDFRQDVRAKKSKFPSPDESCTADDEHLRSTCTADEEHLRSETKTKTKTDAQSPQSGSVELPFQSQDFAEAWEHFVDHRHEIKKPLRPTGAAELLRELAAHQEQEAIAALRKSISNGWQGVFFEAKPNGNGRLTPPIKKPLTPEQIEKNRLAHEVSRRQLEEDARLQREEVAARKAQEAAERSAA